MGPANICSPKEKRTSPNFARLSQGKHPDQAQSAPLPSIQDTIQQLKIFNWETCVDLNVGYYGMKLSKQARKICTIVTPWGLYEYMSMPMSMVVVSNVLEIRLAGLFTHLLHVLVYIDNISIIGYDTFDKHLRDINKVLDMLCHSGVQVNPTKYIWSKDEIKYLGFILTTQGVKPQPQEDPINTGNYSAEKQETIETIYRNDQLL